MPGRILQALLCVAKSCQHREKNNRKGKGQAGDVFTLPRVSFFYNFFFCPSSCVGVVGIGVDVIECIQVYCKIDSSVV